MKEIKSTDSFGAGAELETKSGKIQYYRLDSLTEKGVADISRLPFSIKILLEALMRYENGMDVTKDDVFSLANYNPESPTPVAIPFKPARVLLQDFTGVPCVVDLAAMRSAMMRLGNNPELINPQIPVDLVIDHSVQVDFYSSSEALKKNTTLEFERNKERYEFLRWGQKAFRNFRVIPPSRGICHQVNLEYLSTVVQQRLTNGLPLVFPDSVVGTDSHTTMINGLGIAGWGVGGIEAEAVMLGRPLYMPAPGVIGFKLTGRLPGDVTATDLVLTITEILRRKGVVGKFVEFYGSGLSGMTVPDRATVANMAPEYGATMGYFPVDEQTLCYLRNTGRSDELVDLVERYFRVQGLFRTDSTPDPSYQETIELDLSTVCTSLAGPNQPHNRIDLADTKTSWRKNLSAPVEQHGFNLDQKSLDARSQISLPDGSSAEISHGSVVIAAITSCTNTSNPSVMLGAGLLAKKAFDAGLHTKSWVKTSLAPGSVVAAEYLKETGLLPYLEKLGFFIVGYGCTTCIGNSGPLPEQVARAVDEDNLVVVGIVSGNRNFEGRINPYVKASFLASPPLVVVYAISGTVDIDLYNEPLGHNAVGKPVFLKDIWPTSEEISRLMDKALNPHVFLSKYDGIEHSNKDWNKIQVTQEVCFNWNEASTYIQEPSFFRDMSEKPNRIEPIVNARVLVMAGDSITTDHISPAGTIDVDSPAGKYLMEKGVVPESFNSYGSRRGNHQVMIRGTFANIRLKNQLAHGTEGGWTTYLPTGKITSIYEAAMKYRKTGTPSIVLAGRNYGMGSSRDWAAKGTHLLGVQAVLAESFERIHRSNLVGMGVLPLQFKEGQSVAGLCLTGLETYTIHIDDTLQTNQEVCVEVKDEDKSTRVITVLCRLDTPVEIEYYRNRGLLQTVLRFEIKKITCNT